MPRRAVGPSRLGHSRAPRCPHSRLPASNCGWRARRRAGLGSERRKMWRLRIKEGGYGSSFDRGTTLLAKQVIYFERYGKMFLPDVPLIHDASFFSRLLNE